MNDETTAAGSSSDADVTDMTRTLPRPRKRPTARRAPSNFSRAALNAKAEKIMKGAFAESTWRRRRALQKWWETFCSQIDSPTPVTFFAWLMSNGIMASTMLTYANTFLAIFPHLKTTDTQLFLRALARDGGHRATFQARPLSQDQVQMLYDHIPLSHRMGLFLAWKTASRWSDVFRLRRADIFPISETELVISFPLTKSTALRPYRPDLLVHLVHDTGLNEFYQFLLSKKPKQPLIPVTSPQMLRVLRKSTGDVTVGTHSIKRGAVQLLMDAAAQGTIEPALIGRLAKHANSIQVIPDQTVRYTSNPVSTAVALGTGQATALLRLRL